MLCPLCRSPTRITDTRHQVSNHNTTRRRHACTSCSHRFSTIEFIRPPTSNRDIINSYLKLRARALRTYIKKWNDTTLSGLISINETGQPQ